MNTPIFDYMYRNVYLSKLENLWAADHAIRYDRARLHDMHAESDQSLLDSLDRIAGNC